jgi:hypothetical protein
MRDLVVEKASPLAFLVFVVASLDGPRNLVRGVLFELCMNASAYLASLASFFR